MNEADYSAFFSIDRTIAHLYYGDIRSAHSGRGGVDVNINKAIDKAYEAMGFKELASAPVDAIAGVSGEDAKKLAKLKVATIADFAGLDGSKLTPKDLEVLGACFNVNDAPGLDALRFYKWAKAIVLFSAAEE